MKLYWCGATLFLLALLATAAVTWNRSRANPDHTFRWSASLSPDKCTNHQFIVLAPPPFTNRTDIPRNCKTCGLMEPALAITNSPRTATFTYDPAKKTFPDELPVRYTEHDRTMFRAGIALGRIIYARERHTLTNYDAFQNRAWFVFTNGFHNYTNSLP